MIVPPASTHGHPTRRERERMTRRREIVDAARTVFSRRGFNDATLDEVAELAEFGKGTLYNYFESKEALYASVLQESFDAVMRTAREALSSGRPFEEKIERLVRLELGYMFSSPTSMFLMMREAHHFRGDNPMMQLMPQLLVMIGDTIAAEQRRRRVIANATPLELATILVNMMFGQFFTRVYGRFCCADGGAAAPTEPDADPTRMFSEMKPAEIERQIDAATELIHTVFFHGVTP